MRSKASPSASIFSISARNTASASGIAAGLPPPNIWMALASRSRLPPGSPRPRPSSASPKSSIKRKMPLSRLKWAAKAENFMGG